MATSSLSEENNELLTGSSGGAASGEHAVHRMPFGAELQPDGRVRFRVWAPEARSLHLAVEGIADPLPMQASLDGWHELLTDRASLGSRYRFVLPDGFTVPDPVSRFQPEDVTGPSEVMRPTAFAWRTRDWKGRPWEETVLYELHVGTFTAEGTFSAAIGRLDHLAALGITAIEIMSVGDFPGGWNWGYDGVLLYAPDSSYGHPDDLKAFVDAAHERGMMVIIDVVYNHFGPEGNFLPQYFPDICTDRYDTPWGKALNFDAEHSEQTREFIVHNALYWIEEFRIDGLRLDAVHAIFDSSSVHILEELCRRARSVAPDRRVHFILESDDKMWHLLTRDRAAAPVSCTAQWNHDVQQLAALAFTPEASDARNREIVDRLGRALVEGFTTTTLDSSSSPKLVRKAPQQIPPGGFIAFLQSHDVVGNRIRGERITHLVSTPIVRALAAIYLLLPQIPMLFMGEEWASSSPFPFFCDFGGDLADSVRKGRLEQFGDPERPVDESYWTSIPDPIAKETFLSAKLDWNELSTEPHRSWVAWYREVLAVRRKHIVPLLYNVPENAGSYEVLGPRSLRVRWKLNGAHLCLDANLGETASGRPVEAVGEVVWQEGRPSDSGESTPWFVRWYLQEAQK